MRLLSILAVTCACQPAARVVAPGAVADLILADSNPLDGAIAIPPVGVMTRVTWHTHEQLDAKLAPLARYAGLLPDARL